MHEKSRPLVRRAGAFRETSSCRARRRRRQPVRAALADVSDLFGELRLQRRLAGFRPKTERFQTIAFRVLETDRPAGRLAPACFFVPVGAERNHHPVERDSTGNGFAGFRLADAVHGLLLPFLPETARRFQQTLQVARRRVHASQLSKSLAASRGVQWFRTRRARCAAGFIRQSGPSSTGENESFSERVRKYRTGPNSVGLLRPRSPNLAVPREPGRPFRPDPRCTCRSPPGTTQRPAYPTSKSANAPLPFGPFLDEGCERPERLGGRGPLLDDGRKSSHRLGGHRGEFREGQTMTATLAWECS